MMNRSRSFYHSINDMKAHMSTKTKPPSKAVPNHYDTLNLARNCTQEDVKSNYYELSKQYHPDRNTSADAKLKFQNLSNAYEVLGNFSKRKQYDRDLAARGDKATRSSSSYSSVPEDPLSGFYRSRMSNFDPMRTSDTRTSGNFDFDAWTRAHYGHTLRRSLKDKQGKILREQLKILHEKTKENERHAVNFITTVVIMVTCALGLQYLFDQKYYDRNLIETKRFTRKDS